jgi:glycosyltransferase involved in cell wall biosynthesis
VRIIVSSNAPFVSTGYGNQTRLFTPRLQAAGHDIAIQAFYGLNGGVLKLGEIPVLPGGFHAYGQDRLYADAIRYNADIVITLIDAWVLDPDMLANNGVRFCPWFPVDMEPLPQAVLRVVQKAWQPIVYSQFAVEQCRRFNLEPAYVPHGTDTTIFCPGDKAAARENIGVPAEGMIVGMVAANKGNPSRKSFHEAYRAFAELHARHDDAWLYVHTHMGQENGGVNLAELSEVLGIKDRVIYCDQYIFDTGQFSDGHMADVYRAMDVLLSPSMGEGFGIPILEAQACGTPVLVGDWTSMSELCWAGWKIPKSEAFPFYTPLASYQFMPRWEAVAELLEQAYSHAQSPTLGEQARAGALPYDADVVTQRDWLPLLEQMAGRIEQHNRMLALTETAEKEAVA